MECISIYQDYNNAFQTVWIRVPVMCICPCLFMQNVDECVYICANVVLLHVVRLFLNANDSPDFSFEWMMPVHMQDTSLYHKWN